MPNANMLTFIVILMIGPLACFGQNPSHRRDCDQAVSKRFELASKKLISEQMRPLFCAYRTLEMRLRNASLALIVEARGDADQDDNRTTENVVVRQRIKTIGDHPVEVGDLLRIPFQGDYSGGDHALVFAACDDNGELGITEIQWISRPEANYFSDLAKLADERSRGRFLLKAESGEDGLVSEHAFAELEAIPQEQLSVLFQKDQRDFVMRRLQTPELSASRKSFHLTLLGFVGNLSDIKYLERYVFPKNEPSSFTGPATTAYFRLGDEQAYRKLFEFYFNEPPTPATTDSEKSVQIKRLYPIYIAICEVSPDLARQAKVAEYLIEHTVLGDLVLEDAFRDSDPRFVEPAIQSFHRDGATAYSREESVVYLTGVLDCDLPADRRERINRFLASVQATESDLYQRSIKRLEGRRKFMSASE